MPDFQKRAERFAKNRENKLPPMTLADAAPSNASHVQAINEHIIHFNSHADDWSMWSILSLCAKHALRLPEGVDKFFADTADNFLSRSTKKQTDAAREKAIVDMFEQRLLEAIGSSNPPSSLQPIYDAVGEKFGRDAEDIRKLIDFWMNDNGPSFNAREIYKIAKDKKWDQPIDV